MLKILVSASLALAISCAPGASTADAPETNAVEAPPQIQTGNGVANYIETDGVTRNGASFTFSRVRIDRPGWLVMHPFRNGQPVPTEYVGASLLAAGEHEDVIIDIDAAPQSGDMFVIMLHYDVNEDGVFDFNDGITVPDAPVFEDGVLIALRIAAP